MICESIPALMHLRPKGQEGDSIQSEGGLAQDVGSPPIVDVKDAMSMHSLKSYSRGGKSDFVPLAGDFPN